QYRISVRQQPAAARSCGFGDRDRRAIDPPPIVQLTVDDPDATPAEIYSKQRRLMGTVVASPFVGEDENGVKGCFFCFPDLSCRTPGTFRLRFSFVVMPSDPSIGSRTKISAFAMSDKFTVYHAKDFPGMTPSSALTKKLKDQGCLISIKKG
ncbi:velvet factor-domain-containing protein, partial [Xylariales sp. PMI_506]